MSSISPINQPERPSDLSGSQKTADAEKQQVSWMLKAYFAFLQLEVEKGIISAKDAKNMESSLKQLQSQVNEVSSKEELRALISSLNNQLDIVNKQIKQYYAKGKQKEMLAEMTKQPVALPSAELVEGSRGSSGVLAQIQLLETYLNEAKDQGVLDRNQESGLWNETKKLWESVENGTLRQPDEAMAKLQNIIKKANQVLPEKYQFPEISLEAYNFQ